MRFRIWRQGDKFYPQYRPALSPHWFYYADIENGDTFFIHAVSGIPVPLPPIDVPAVCRSSYDKAVQYVVHEEGIDAADLNHGRLRVHEKKDGLLMIEDDGQGRLMTWRERFKWFYEGQLPESI